MADDSDINATAASVLGFLGIGPMTGWDLNDFAQISVGNFWSMTRSQIYRELRTLEEKGLVEGEDTGFRDQRRFSLTDTGRARLREWLREPPGPEINRNPFLVKLFFSGELPPREVARLVASARQLHEEHVARYEEVLPMAEELSPFAAATARYGIAVEKAILAWFDEEPWRRA